MGPAPRRGNNAQAMKKMPYKTGAILRYFLAQALQMSPNVSEPFDSCNWNRRYEKKKAEIATNISMATLKLITTEKMVSLKKLRIIQGLVF